MIIGGTVTGFALLIVVLILFGISVRHGQADKKLLMGLKTNAGADQELAVLKTPNLGANGTIGKKNAFKKQKIYKSPGQKKLVKSNKSKNLFVKLHFGNFKLFPSSKIDFWPFLK